MGRCSYSKSSNLSVDSSNETNLVYSSETLHERSDELRALTAKLNIAESSTQNQMTALDSTQRQLARVTEQHSQAESFIKELEVGQGQGAGARAGAGAGAGAGLLRCRILARKYLLPLLN